MNDKATSSELGVSVLRLEHRLVEFFSNRDAQRFQPGWQAGLRAFGEVVTIAGANFRGGMGIRSTAALATFCHD